MASEALDEFINTLAPKEQAVNESIFLSLKFEPQEGAKLGVFEVAFKANSENSADKWQSAYDLLSKANATIKDRYHSKEYAFSYWLYGTDKIYRQKLKQGA